MAALRRNFLLSLLCMALFLAPLWAFKEFVMPHAETAATYPSHDAHSNERVTAAIDLYYTSPKDDIFSTRYIQE